MAFEYEHFDIIEVAKYCGIQFHPKNSNDVEFKALCPFCNDRKYHLGINRQKERFNCFKCGESGNSVTLYAKLYGVSNKEACEVLRGNKENFEPAVVQYSEVDEMPIRSIEDRHNVYYDFLSLLKLNTAHRHALEMRGLSFRHIHQFMYRSMPMDRVFRREVLEKLASKHDLIGIPGFYIDKYGDLQMYINKHGGIFIPVCNHEGYIQGLQMRLDVPADSDEKKFRWFSSKHYPSGTGAKPWIHIVGDTNAKEACLTEGAMKADVTSVLSNGQLFIAVPGVNAITYLPEIINELGITRIYEAMDMDKRSKPEVKKAMIALRTALNGTGVENISCTWNPAYKGLDDYFLAKVLEKQSQAMPVAA
ncbi:MAG: DUF3854 domain-containing protein [Clostridia bacterium]|nr:DUF3854 domain-containing protein [Clostridia bacterium]